MIQGEPPLSELLSEPIVRLLAEAVWKVLRLRWLSCRCLVQADLSALCIRGPAAGRRWRLDRCSTGLIGDDEEDRAQPAVIAAIIGAMPMIVITRFRL